MHVILIFTYGISLQDWNDSGILKREIMLYEELSQKYDVKFTFITFGDESDHKFIKNKNIKIFPVYEHFTRSDSRVTRLLKSLTIPFSIKKYAPAADIIKTNQLNGVWIAILLKKLLRKPLIVRTGYNLYEFSINESKTKFIQLFHKIITKLALKISDIYTVTSVEDSKFLKSNFKFNKEIMVIPNWVDSLKYENYEDRYNDKILTVGRIEKQKDYDSLIRAVSSTKFSLDIIGEGEERKNLQNLVDEIRANVSFKGRMDFDELSNYYKKYKVFVSSSLYEGNPKVVLEAMASGCLVIAKNNKNNKELITNAETGYLYETNDELIEILKTNLLDLEKNNEITKNAYSQIKENNLFSVIVKKELNNYKKLDKD
jgi:glycosyltransferase involved in cell wall biosynthesis